MRNDDNYNDYNSSVLYLLEQPASRPVGDAIVWLKHLLMLPGGKLPQWILTAALMCISTAVICGGLLFVLHLLGFEEALKQKEAWTWVATILFILFVNMLPLFFMAGFVSIVAGVAEEGEFTFGRLFAGFGDPMLQLIKLFLFWLLALFALGIVAGLGINGGWMLLLVVLLLLLCNWMALPLIMLQGVSPLDAIWMSLVGSLKNIVPLGGFVLAMLAMVLGISFWAADGLRLLMQHGNNWLFLLLLAVFYTVLCAVFPIISYVSYRNIWTGAPLE